MTRWCAPAGVGPRRLGAAVERRACALVAVRGGVAGSGYGGEVAERSKKRRRRRPLIEWRRLPKRVVLLINFCLGAVVLGLVIVPFDAPGDGDTRLRCGPPLFEVIVPADPDFDVPENIGCMPPARTRLILSGAVFAGLVTLTVLTEVRGRRSAQDRQAIWLAGGRRRAIIRARQLPPPRRRPPPRRPESLDAPR